MVVVGADFGVDVDFDVDVDVDVDVDGDGDCVAAKVVVLKILI